MVSNWPQGTLCLLLCPNPTWRQKLRWYASSLSCLGAFELIKFTGSGLWMPEAQPLALLRQNIHRKSKKFRQVLTEPQMRKQILGVSSNDEKKAIKAFADQNKENALKTKPKVCVFFV